MYNLSERVFPQKQSLFISAGHSEADPGATGNGYSEADLVLEFRDRVARELHRQGAVFYKDGSKGRNLPLREAADMASKMDVSVEFHFNAFSSASATGSESLSSHRDYELASALSETVSNALGIPDRGAKTEDSGQHSRLAFVQAGGVILEIGFLTNPNDLNSFLDQQDALASAVAETLLKEVRFG